MRSATLRSFWSAYDSLPEAVKEQARKAFRLWSQDPFHPSLRFKCVGPAESVWSVRITLGYRALGIWEGDSVTWFWVGSHDDYVRFLRTGS